MGFAQSKGKLAGKISGGCLEGCKGQRSDKRLIFYFSGETRTLLKEFQQEKLEMDEGSYVKSVLAKLKDKQKNTVGEITDAIGDASLLETEVLGRR